MNKRRLFTILVLFLSVPVLASGQSQQLADSLFSQGQQFDASGNNREAEFYYREAYNMYQQLQDTASWLEAGKEYASAMVYRSKNDQAMELYRMLLEVDHPANDDYNRGDLYNSMGWSSKRAGYLEDAMKYYKRSLPLAEASGDSLLIGVVYDNIGSVYVSRGNYAQALEYTRRALPYFEGLGNRGSITTTLGNLGNIYENMGLFDQALEYLERSLEIREEIGNVNMLASTYIKLGVVHRKFGNYDQALVSYEKALEYAQQSGNVQSQGTVYNNLGLLYKNLGDLDKAREYYQQSLDIVEENSGPGSIATTTRNLGILLWERGETEQAQELYQKALDLRKQIGNPYDIASSLSNLVKVAINEQNFQQAEEYITQIEAIGDSTDSYEILRDGSNWRGVLVRNQGDVAAAVPHFERAYSYSQFVNASSQITPLQNLAHSYHQLNSERALEYGQKAINLIEQGRNNVGAVSRLKANFFEKYADFYVNMAAWTIIHTGDKAAAYQLVESAKARTLAEELNEASLGIDEQLPEEVRIERNNRLEKLDSLYTEHEMAADEERQAEIQGQIRTAELNYEAYENDLRRRYPQYKNLQPPTPVSLQQAQYLNDDNTAMVEYAVTDDHLLAFFITNDEVQIHGQDLAPAADTTQFDSELAGNVQKFRDAILSNAYRQELDFYSSKLYRMLLAPFEEEMAEISNLMIIPDGPLAYLPFEALAVNNRYLIEDYHVKYMPSATSLTLLRDRNTEQPEELLAVAGSEFTEESLSEFRQKAAFSALPSTVIEVDSIASHFNRVTKLKDEEVTESTLKTYLNDQYRYIHLATHGIMDEQNPSQSGLLLSTEGGLEVTSKEDGLLKTSEIYRLNLNSDMVVLSACNTALGKNVDGEGMLGLQRAFFYAGTSSVVASLWSVYDRSSAYMMNEFYKALLESEAEEAGWIESFLRWVGWEQSLPFGEKATAMREAKLDMIDHPLFSHPVYWAPFIVVGR